MIIVRFNLLIFVMQSVVIAFNFRRYATKLTGRPMWISYYEYILDKKKFKIDLV